VKNETAAISWNETAAILNMAFSRKMNPESGYRGCLVIPVVVSSVPGTYGIQYLVLRY
jgi:hypothetical protein